MTWSLIEIVDTTQNKASKRDAWATRYTVTDGSQEKCETLFHYDKLPDDKTIAVLVAAQIDKDNIPVDVVVDILEDKKSIIDAAIQKARDSGNTDDEIVAAITSSLDAAAQSKESQK